MTSYGVEFDTNVLIFLPERKLPDGVKIKVPFFKDKKIEMTLEIWNPEKQQATPEDCLVSLEAQIGIFWSDNPKKFNVEDFKRVCVTFIREWNTVVQRKRIFIGEKEYDIVIYDKKGGFADCGLSIKSTKNLGYTKDFMLQNAVGMPQITFGIQLQYIISIFAYISKLYNKHNDPKSPTLTLYAVYLSYTTVGYYTAENNIKDLKIIAFLMLLSYYINCNVIYKADRSSYVKAYFAFKIRTNLRIIYDNIGKPEKIVKVFLANLAVKAGDIVTKLSEDFFNPIRAYVISDTSKNLEIPPLTITKNNPNYSFTPVDVFLSWWNREFPEVKEVSNTISYLNTPSIDFGEWTIGQNNIIYIEYRAIFATMIMIKPSLSENLENLTVQKFCFVIQYIMEKILNKALEVDPRIIIPEQSI